MYRTPPATAPTSGSAATVSFWDPPEQSLREAGAHGELLLARVRLGFLLVLALLPLGFVLTAPAAARPRFLVGLTIVAIDLLCAAALYLLVRSHRHRPWVPVATSLFDVTTVTGCGIGFVLAAGPDVLASGKVIFDIYFLALAGTCVRYDKRIALLAGVAAVVEFVALIAWVASTFHLTSGNTAVALGFRWEDQAARVLLLVSITAWNTYLVSSIQTQKRLSNVDPLTGAFNRRFFDDFIANELAYSARHGTPLAVAMIDVDHFKQFNDRNGHDAGDRALRQVALTLQHVLRVSDLLARYGGEEFVVVFRDSDASHAMARVEEIRRAVADETLMLADGTTRTVTVSCGVASWPDDGHALPELLGEADRRLFMAKHAGRNRVVGPTAAPVSRSA